MRGNVEIKSTPMRRSERRVGVRLSQRPRAVGSAVSRLRFPVRRKCRCSAHSLPLAPRWAPHDQTQYRNMSLTCAPGRIRTRDPLLRRCRTVVRCSRLPGEIARARLIAGHGVRTCWCRLWVSQSSLGSSNLPALSLLLWNSAWTCITAAPVIAKLDERPHVWHTAGRNASL